MLMNARARADALYTSRQAVLRARRYTERLAEMEAAQLRAITYDTPRVQSCRGESSQHVYLVTVERVRQAKEMACREAETAQRRARHYLETMPVAMALFAEGYYVVGLTLAEASKLCDRTERQCHRYQQQIFTYDRDLPIEQPEHEDALEEAEMPPRPLEDAPRPGARQPAIKAATGAHSPARAQNSGLAAPQAQVCP